MEILSKGVITLKLSKKLFHKLKNLFFYNGLNKTEYDLIADDLHKFNNNVAFFSFIFNLCIFMSFWIASLFIDVITKNNSIYLFCVLCDVLLCVFLRVFGKHNEYMNRLLIYVGIFQHLFSSIVLGVFVYPDFQAVIFLLLIMFLPILFAERIVNIISTTLISILLFLMLSLHFKSGDILVLDVTYCLIFGFLGLFYGSISNMVRVRNIYHQHHLKHVSRLDALTSMNNRNAFEENVSKYYAKCNSALACIYIDVNGLHELNNTQGHAEGDKMLKSIAYSIRKHFGCEDTYRIGGDEFVIFAIDLAVIQLDEILKDMLDDITSNGYYVAVGFESSVKSNLDVNKLIKEAEIKMYENKSNYYTQIGNDRRSR